MKIVCTLLRLLETKRFPQPGIECVENKSVSTQTLDRFYLMLYGFQEPLGSQGWYGVSKRKNPGKTMRRN